MTLLVFVPSIADASQTFSLDLELWQGHKLAILGQETERGVGMCIRMVTKLHEQFWRLERVIRSVHLR